jgi:U-box domain
MIECSERYDDSRAANNSYPQSPPPRLPQLNPITELELAPSSDAARNSTTTTTCGTSATIVMMTTTAIPASFLCPITGRLMEDPVMDSCGHTYERRAILGYLKQCTRRGQQQPNNNNNICRCPFSQKPLTVHDLIPNHALGERIDKWRWRQEFDCSSQLFGDNDDNDDLSRFVDVELQKGQASFDENRNVQQAAHVDKANEDDARDGTDDEDDDDRDNRRTRNRGPRRSYWGQRRGARHQRQKRYAPVSQQLQQPPSSPGGAMSLSSGSTTRSDDAGASFPARKSVAEWHPELLLLPQELHILSFVQERSERERQKNLRDRRIKWARRCVATLVVLVLLAGAALGLVLVADHWKSWSAASGSGSEGEPSSQERDEGRENNSTTMTDPPARLTYEYERR